MDVWVALVATTKNILRKRVKKTLISAVQSFVSEVHGCGLETVANLWLAGSADVNALGERRSEFEKGVQGVDKSEPWI
jgi:hypothetical protein